MRFRSQIQYLLVTAAVAAAGAVVLARVPAPAAVPTKATVESWHQFLGPERNNISRETGWKAAWGEGGPEVLWRASVGIGYSGITVADGRAYTMGNRDKTDTVWCFDAATGREIWKHTYPCRGGTHPGPRCSPTIDGNRVYTVSYEGDLHCLKADKAEGGQVVWKKDMKREFGTKIPSWGIACSPLVDGDVLYVDGGVVVALNKTTGRLIWKTENYPHAYSSPLLFTHDGKKRLAVFNSKGLFILDAAEGGVLAHQPWKTSYGCNTAVPIVSGEKIFISSGYGTGCALLRFTGKALETIWRNREMRNHFSNCVLWKGHLYGIDGNVGRTSLKCMDFATGEAKWSQPTGRMASLLLSDEKLIVLTDPGELIVCKASPSGYEEISRAKVASRPCWTPPTLSGGRIYCRSHTGALVCVDVRGGK